MLFRSALRARNRRRLPAPRESVSPPRKPLAPHSMPERIRQCPPASYATVLRQRFTLQTQNAVVAPLVPQIHTHRQTIEIGAKLASLMLFSGARCCGLFRIQLFLQLSHQLCQHFLRIPSDWASRLRLLRCRFTLLSRIVMLLQGRSPYPL